MPSDIGTPPRRSAGSLGPVNRKVRAIGFAIWAGLAVPLVFASYVGLSYRFALREGKLPFLPPNEWRWDSAYFTLLASGVVAIALIPMSRLWVRVLLATLYAAVMGLALLFVSLNLSCGSGDCL
jgi:hypothetical protein